MITANQKAFLDMIAASELSPQLLRASDNGYNVLVGSTPRHPITFGSYADHPRVFNSLYNSTAAGRYQILEKNYDFYKVKLGLKDFGPASQDAIALELIKERQAIQNIEAGYIRLAITQCNRAWASFPGNSYGQHQNSPDELLAYYQAAGGQVIA